MSSVAIVILNYNGEQMLRNFLPSVAANSPGAEIVVADNASTDGSIKVMQEEFPQVRAICLEKNFGFTGGYNRAFEQIDSDLFVLINSDIEVTEGWLEPLVRWMQEHPDCGACAPKLHSWQEREKFEYAGAAGGHIDRYGYPFCRGRIMSNLEKDHGQYDGMAPEVFWASGACLMVRSPLYERLGGLDNRFFAHMEEIDLQWRMQLGGWRIAVEPRSVVYHLGGGTLPASPNKIYLNHRNNLAMLFKCSSSKQRMVVAVLRPFTDIAEALAHLLMLRPRNAWAILRAWWAFIKWHKMLGRKRREVVRLKGVELRGIYPRSIIVRYLFGKKTFNKVGSIN